jgi:hypothetical protein
MSISLRFDAGGVAHLTVEGEFALDEAIDSMRELYEETRYTEPTRLLWDLRAARFTLSNTEIEMFADFIRTNRTQGRGRAAVVATEDLSFGLSQMYGLKTYDIPVDVEAFRDFDDAINWLKEEF